MIIGNTHNLSVSSIDRETVWLDAPEGLQIPLPLVEAKRASVGDRVQVFVYTDANANPVATTSEPLAKLGECANMPVRQVSEIGAFLDWGLPKNLLLPFNEQRRPIDEGNRETVLVYLDKSGRLAASSRIDHHLQTDDSGFDAWQPVSLLVYQRTDLGFKAIVDNRAVGLLYKDEIFTQVKVGQSIDGYVKRLRQDHRLDLALQLPAAQLKDDINAAIIQYLKNNNGVSYLTDKSDPNAIYAEFGVSKKNFKRGLSALYKQRRIKIEPDRVLLVNSDT